MSNTKIILIEDPGGEADGIVDRIMITRRQGRSYNEAGPPPSLEVFFYVF